MVELGEPILIEDDWAEDPLLVTIENERHKTTYRDAKLEAFASSKPGSHVPIGVAKCTRIYDYQ